ncbi:MAG: class I SAM-dependent methyltransferase [Roseibacillus sp.]
MSNSPKLHLACGRRFHPDWHNLDFSPMVEGVIVHNLTEPLPYETSSVACCHSAHVLGHFRKEQAEAFLSEQLRVLEPGGIARFAVPDLQQVIHEYRELIGPLCEGDYDRAADYEWNQIELYDQVDRSFYGGKMAKFLAQDPVPNRDYVIKRIGEEGRELMDAPHDGKIVQTKLKLEHLGYYFKKARLKLTRGVVQILAGKEAALAFHEGCFRRFSGEVQWKVYDQYSLTRDLLALGFTDIRRCHHDESRIPDFKDFSFDSDEQGNERKPESLYLEATKP